MARSNVIVFPPFASKKRLFELACWAWGYDQELTSVRARSGNSFLVLRPVDSKNRESYRKMLLVYR